MLVRDILLETYYIQDYKYFASSIVKDQLVAAIVLSTSVIELLVLELYS